MKIVIITGISGTEIDKFVDDTVILGNNNGNENWTHIRFAKLMYDAEPNKIADYNKWEEGILRRNTSLSHLRDKAFDILLEKKFELIAEEERTRQEQIMLISTHATFWFCKTLLPGLNPSRINELEPNIFITIIDDVIDCWKRLLDTKQTRWRDLSPVDILEWREIEVFTTEILAAISGQRRQPKPFYLVEKRYNPEMLVSLVVDNQKKKYYRSYPITFVSKHPEAIKQANRLGDELSKISIVFNPMGITDYDRKKELKELYSNWCKERGYNESESSWKEIESHLSSQTVSRDHRLIDQSDGIVVYYPELVYFIKEGKNYLETKMVPFSSGVLDEMQYAIQFGKIVYLVWTSEKDAGPFLANIYTEKFKSIDEFIDYLRSK